MYWVVGSFLCVFKVNSLCMSSSAATRIRYPGWSKARSGTSFLSKDSHAGPSIQGGRRLEDGH